jgi:hypothetical protein
LAAASFGTGFSDAESLLRKVPVAGLYQRDAVPTLPVSASVQPDWKPSRPLVPAVAVTLPSGS